MIKTHYHCLVAGLPDIFIDGNKPGATSLEFKKELAEVLTASDYKLAQMLYQQFDNKNLLNLLLKQENSFNPLGNYSEAYLEKQVKEPVDIAEYIKQFIAGFNAENSDGQELTHENQLQSFFYAYALSLKNNFLQQWFRFDRDTKNILTAVNCRKYAYDLEKQLIPVKGDNVVYDILLKNTPKPELLTEEVPYVAEILKIAESEMDPALKEKALDQLRWTFLDEITLFNYFTIEVILSYIIKLNMVDRWMKLDDETGKKLFAQLLEDIKTSYTFPEEFSVKK